MKVQKQRLKLDLNCQKSFMWRLVYIRDLLSPLLLAIVVDVVKESAREGLMKKILYADDLVHMIETMEGMKKRLLKWKSALESKGVKVNLEKTKVIVCGSEREVTPSRSV